MKTVSSVKQLVIDTLESGITPIVFDYHDVVFFGKDARMMRTFMVFNSLDLGTLTFKEYRFVARRTRQGFYIVKRHVEKLLRLIPKFIEKYPQVEGFTVPVFPRMVISGELTSVLREAFSFYPQVHPSKICIEVSADILYEDVEVVKPRLEEIRDLGVKIAINEVGDEYCPLFKLTELPFDMILLDSFATEKFDRIDAERVVGGLIKYLHSFGVPVIAPDLSENEMISNAKLLGCDGYSLTQVITALDYSLEPENAEDIEENEENVEEKSGAEETVEALVAETVEEALVAEAIVAETAVSVEEAVEIALEEVSEEELIDEFNEESLEESTVEFFPIDAEEHAEEPKEEPSQEPTEAEPNAGEEETAGENLKEEELEA